MATGFDFSEVKELADDLGKAIRRLPSSSKQVVDDAARRVERDWREHANITAGAHGVHYPGTVGFDRPSYHEGRWVTEVGPDAAMPQGGMGEGFEYGSVNQDSPHLDGHFAADREEPRFGVAAAQYGVDYLRMWLERR